METVSQLAQNKHKTLWIPNGFYCGYQQHPRLCSKKCKSKQILCTWHSLLI